MEETAARITFANGSHINAEKNGDCLITNQKRTFPEDLSIVTVECGDQTIVYHNAVLVECASVDGRYWFSFVETPPEALRLQQMQDNIRVIAELTDVDLDAEDPTLEISLKERINDLEIAICEIMDAMA